MGVRRLRDEGVGVATEWRALWSVGVDGRVWIAKLVATIVDWTRSDYGRGCAAVIG